MRTLKVQTIYPAFMGEVNPFGIGAPCVFVRLSGCNIRCYENLGMQCDTPEALTGICGKEMKVEDIMDQVMLLSESNLICLTGGEPLLQKNVVDLIDYADTFGYHVAIETNGTVDFSYLRELNKANYSIIMDVKAPSTGCADKNCESNVSLLRETDWVKFVLKDEEDYKSMVKWFTDHKECKAHLSCGLFWGTKELSYKKLTKRILTSRLPIYLNMQTHKMMCLYDSVKSSEDICGIYIPKDL